LTVCVYITSFMIIDLLVTFSLEKLSVDQWDLLMVLKVAKPWGFCDLAL
jgi:hypothetical protein